MIPIDQPFDGLNPPSSDDGVAGAVSGGARATALGIPTLDEMAGDWIPITEVANPPAVHNFNQMLAVDRDLTSFFCHPGELYPWRHGYPIVKLEIDNREYQAEEVRCYAYRALRRNAHCSGVLIETDTRMVNEQRGVLFQIHAVNTTLMPRKTEFSLHVPGKLHPDGMSVLNDTQRDGVVSVAHPSRQPDKVAVEKDVVIWKWMMELPVGGNTTLGFAIGDEVSDKAAETDKRVADWARRFAVVMADCKQVWENRWADAFTPGNTHFSGHLPVLQTKDAALSRNYYMGVQTMLVLERTQFPVHPRSFITSGEREDGCQYYWDASMQATVWALLEPAGMKATLRRWLVQNPRWNPVIDIRHTKGFDTGHHDSIKGYAFNACPMFKTADEYLRVTGDRAFLDEELEDGKTVLEHLDALATDWETLPKGPRGLACYGENANLLECAPAYIHCVPSANAQNVWMMRQAATWRALHGDTTRAQELRDKADVLRSQVIGLYKAGDGVWNAYQMDGKLVELRHCVDFIYVGNALQNDLTAMQKSEMNAFVKRELFMRDWMRAMSQKDAAAQHSDRPDHGPMGAFDGWIPLTVGTMWRLGAIRDAYDFFCRTAVVAGEGPFAQAHEFYGPTRGAYDAPVRVAERGGCMKECISGVAFADIVINTFFGFMPASDGKTALVDPKTPRPFTGKLCHVRNHEALCTIFCDESGVRIEKE